MARIPSLKSLNAFPHAEEHLLKKTYSGAVVTILGLLIMITLFVHELQFYLTTYTVHQPFISGLEKRVLRSMPVEVYGAAAVAADAEVCAICLGEFADGEKVRVLPRCAHGFHVRCVDTWLLSHDSCPTCRRSVLDGATKAASSAAPVGGGGRRQGSEAAAIAVVIG